MKGFSISLVVLLVLAAVSAPVALSEQSPSQTAAASQNTEDIPFMLVELSGSLNAKKLKPGDPIRAQVIQDVLSHGKIVIPAESKLLGHVTEANARSESVESRLGLVFDKVLLKHHGEMGFQGIVQAVAPPVPKTLREDEAELMFPPLSLPGQNNPPNPINSGTAMGNRGSGNQPRGNQPFPDARNMPGSILPGSPGYRPNTTIQDTSAQNRSLSLGTRQGVFGLQGVSLSTEKTGLTPGPVIVSKVADVKLESGTQLLLKITTPVTGP
jgi:hypothetical protein